jgi:rod shape-determining protein MreC
VAGRHVLGRRLAVDALMALPDIRQRVGYLFVAVAVGHIILISAQVNSRAGVPLLEAAVFEVFSQAQRVASAAIGGVRTVWREYVDLRAVRLDNQALERQVADLEVELQQQRALAQQSAALRQLLDLHDRSQVPTRSAEVIAGSPAPDFRTVTIDRGTGDGVRADMAVIAASGVVGRVVMPTRWSAKVQLLIDRNAAAAALVERSRTQGIVVGGGDDTLRMEFVSATGDVRAGDVLVTSGIDGIYPKGFVIGSVDGIERAGVAYKLIKVRPAVDFSGIEHVLVVLTLPSGPPAGGSE